MYSLTDPLPVTSTERLRAIAKILQATPERWEQDFWLSKDDDRFHAGRKSPLEAIAAFGPINCETNKACIAGWGLLLTPTDQLRELPEVDLRDGWGTAGAATLGLQPNDDDYMNRLSYYLFSERLNLNLDYGEVADVLNVLADIAEEDRCWDTFASVCPDLAEQIADQ